jgi:hypothetical protein
MNTKAILAIAGIMLFTLTTTAQTKKNVTRQKTAVKSVKKAAAPIEDPKLVDLGLPSGTKWADRNMGARSSSSGGGYYAFGETSEKQLYKRDNYTFKADLADIAGTEYDAATKKYGKDWSIPTSQQWHELIDNCTQELIMVNKQLCIKFTGKNGNSIFLPSPYPIVKAGTAEETKSFNKQFLDGLESAKQQIKAYGINASILFSVYRASDSNLLIAIGVAAIASDGSVQEYQKEIEVNSGQDYIYGGFQIRPVSTTSY